MASPAIVLQADASRSGFAYSPITPTPAAAAAPSPDPAPPCNLVVSNGDSVTVGIAPAQTVVYAQGSATAATGPQLVNLGLITLFN